MTYGTYDLSPMQAFGYTPAPAVRLLPFQTDPIAAAYANGQLAPAGWFGNLISGLAPVAGKAIGGTAGQAISTIGGLGRYLPFDVDPVTAAYANGQLAPAGWFGNLISGLAPVAGKAIGGTAGQAISTIGGFGRYLPFDVDPVTAAYANGQLAPAGWFGNLISGIAPVAGRMVGGTAGQAISTIGGLGRYLPFDVDPVAAAYGAPVAAAYANPVAPVYANGQLAPQGFFGGLLGGIAGGLGGRAIGGLFGGSGGAIGSTVGSTLGRIAGGLLPFQVDPMTGAYVPVQYV
jgi:hypothetical protein